jgi:ABC-type transport system involved in multi-copper enzyme maturation permease subunit
MLKKEVWEAIKKGLECLLLLGIIPLAFLGDRWIMKFNWEFREIFSAVFVTTVIFYSVYAGATIFQSERKDRAFEYLFSLPISRSKILLMKLAPRLIILIFLVIILILIFKIGASDFGIIFFVLFFISVFLSVGVNSIMVNLIGVIMLLYVQYSLWQILMNFSFVHGLESRGYWIIPTFQLIATALLLVPMGTAFWLTFKKMDVKPMKLQMRTYYAIVLPTLVIIIIFVSITFKKYLIDY